MHARHAELRLSNPSRRDEHNPPGPLSEDSAGPVDAIDGPPARGACRLARLPALVPARDDPCRIAHRPLLRSDHRTCATRLHLGSGPCTGHDRPRRHRVTWRPVPARGTRAPESGAHLRPLHRPPSRPPAGGDAIGGRPYLDEMSKLILKWDGLIDKYVGDEIMALWNAPLPQANHALLAIRCAYDLVNNAPAVQAKLAARGLPPIGWGIGINTGPAVVGNMGSQDRLQYTALGDTVNTGARFCSAAPAFEVLIGQPTYQACADYIAVDELPGLQLKGKSAETFRLFKVTAIRENTGSRWVPMPTDPAREAYTAKKQLYATQSVFA